ncbi:cruciferin [Actinidia rufa]|uniref:Cruciferin n=1 Tax=Actinidia rufa TaxID=165716 RepID=A0A7J0E740_9ERIC|nr:cruciferin [Actinidia rufa]
MDCGVYAAAAAGLWARVGGGSGGGRGGVSCEGEHDLAVMVSDFLEDDSGVTDSRYSSDSDSGFCDLAHLAHNISYCKYSVNQYESDLLSVVDSLMQSINGTDLHFAKSAPCNAGCIRFSLVKLLRLSGYDAAVCTSKWQACRKVPGGDHEYIDVFNYKQTGGSERLIIDIDFRSHFEIARAVESYDRILNSLPDVNTDVRRKSQESNAIPPRVSSFTCRPPFATTPYARGLGEARTQDLPHEKVTPLSLELHLGLISI